ncbi:TPA: MATE family efflux transporter [Clostridioides difficile]
MKKVDLTQGKVLSVISALAIPIMGGSLLQFAYNMIDMLWVGGLGSDAVASIGSASFLIGLGYSINALVVIGTGIKVAQSIGKNDDVETSQYINTGLLINGIIGVAYALFIIFGSKYFIKFLNLENINVQRDVRSYLMISAPMLLFAFYNLLYTRIFGSFGNNKEAFKISLVGIIINIVLDPIFIYVFKFGVLGAGIATLIANIIMFLMFIAKCKNLFKLDLKSGMNIDKINEVVRLGFPMAFQRILFTIVNIILARIIAKFGSDAIAAQKIGLQIESISYMVIGGLNGALASFTGQNFGSKKDERIDEGYKVALNIGIIYTVVTAIIFIVTPQPIVRLFVREETTVLIASGYLRIIAISQIFSAIEMVTNGLFTGIGIPKISANISIIFTVLRIPMAIIFVKYLGVNGIWWSISISSILKGITSYLIYILKVRKRYDNVRNY